MLRQSCRTLDSLLTFGFGILTSEVGSFPVLTSRTCVLRDRLGGLSVPPSRTKQPWRGVADAAAHRARVTAWEWACWGWP